MKLAKHIFGGPDTSRKLRCLQEYLQAFSIALQNQEFACIYIDAFAGSGTRTEVRPGLPLFGPDFAEPEEITTPGSARIAIEIDPPMHSIVLIEQDSSRFSELKNLVDEYPDRKIIVRNGDANKLVQRLCVNTTWRGSDIVGRGIRGVIFLDPYGMEVSWETVEAIAKTEALDCWYFFPLLGLYRNAPHDPAKLDLAKQASLDRVLGAADWRSRWYNHEVMLTDIFETQGQAVRRADVSAIEAYVKERLETTFKGAVLDPVRLHHKNGAPLASLFFAVSNTSSAAVKLATKMASHILNSGRSSHKRSR
ncbi:three-Cys-motif partner protein TcmP [Mesorhizobium sp. B2-3-5]|uniref:three-Cys-motif partner protein TcmP n=1 Tax=Mesorhizobium sp. B2-3-5 TaxID=2589958 RepID=UPI001129B14C|nr:three-Cys-motif partner protein TcmP [Mesorhizobium sp. B2-3-5]TPM25064.1 three-Cys-motif partner protein TcmP [Mesorhizobium sp. B2-3-5]